MSTTAAAALAKKRVRRQKQVIAVGSVALMAILGYQLPKLLGGHGNSSAPAVTTTAATPTPPAGVATGAPAPVAGLRDTDGIAQQRDTSQLVSFGLFKSKDPFVQQLSSSASPAVKPTPIVAPAPKKRAKPARKPPTTPTPLVPLPPVTTTPLTTPTSTVPATTPVIPSGTAPSVPVTPTPAPPASPNSVLISTNGVCEQVSVNGTFPATEDIFRVVEIAKDGKSVKIAVVGGSYDSGQATATAKLGEKLTLVNTSDGSRYVIVLQAKCKVVAPTAAAPAPTPAVPAPSPPPVQSPVPAPAPTSTPIVTDSSDTAPPPSN